MNIAFVNSTRKWGGVKTWSIDMSESLIRHGHQAFIVGRPGAFVEKATHLGIPAEAHAFGFDFNPFSIAYFLRYLSKNRIDVLICNISKDLRTAGVAAKILGIPIVHRLGAPQDVVDRFKTRITQRITSAHLLTNSDFVRDKLLNNVPLYNEYDFGAIFPGTKPNPVPPSACHTPRTIIATSQLNQDKGHAHLLQAMASLKKRGYDFRCIIVGTGKIEEQLHQMGRDLGIDDRIEWTGFVTDVQSQLLRADIFVLPTFCEPLGISLEEAMANGLVPIARKAGGPREIWPPELEHLLILPKSNEHGFETALATLLDTPEDELIAMKQYVHTHASQTFSLDTQAEKFLNWLKRFV